MTERAQWGDLVAATEAALVAFAAGELAIAALQDIVSARAGAIAELTETTPTPADRPAIARLVELDQRILELCATRLAELATARGRSPRPTEAAPRVVSDVA